MRVAVFAHYDADRVVDTYVLYYLEALRDLCGRVVFVSDGDLPQTEMAKLASLADHIITYRHGEYDFGSYKRGFDFARSEGWMEDADQLVFANDSCYGPLTPLGEVFEKMEATGADAWSISANNFGYRDEPAAWHMQSFFCVFDRKVFSSQGFAEILDEVKAQEKKGDIISLYEIGLSQWIAAAGFTMAAYTGDTLMNISNPFYWRWKELFRECRVPFIKVAVVSHTAPRQWNRIIARNTLYPFCFISGHRTRTGALSMRTREGDVMPFAKKIRTLRHYTLRIHTAKRRICVLGVWYHY